MLDKITLCKLEILKAAINNFDMQDYDTSANRSYYCVFHMMCAVLMLDGLSYSKHSAVIAKFRELYLKTGIVDRSLSKIIDDTRDLRDTSDYGVAINIEKNDAENQINNAKIFYNTTKIYIDELFEKEK